jgi:MerR family transcriptional regulator, light-induced transcriptional regulator
MHVHSMLGRDASDALLAKRHEIANAVIALEFARHPELDARYGATARQKCLEDDGYHLTFLAQALAFDSDSLFTSYVAWAKVVLAHRRVLAEDLAFHLRCLAEVIQEQFPPEIAEAAVRIVESALAQMPGMPVDAVTILDDTNPRAALARRYLKALLEADRPRASREIQDALAEGVPAESLYLNVFAATQREIGRLWQMNEISVAQEHFSTAATQMILAQVAARFLAEPKGKESIVVTCVAGELHELGPRMVAEFFEMAGWSSVYLGANTPHQGVLDTLVATGARTLAVSTSIGFHVSSVEDLIGMVRADPRCANVRVLVGGHPFAALPTLWKSIGADGQAGDAKSAVEVATRLSLEAA